MANALSGFFKTLLLFLTRRVEFDRNAAGKDIIMDDGLRFTIFRRVIIRDSGSTVPGAFFLVRFKPGNMTAEQNVKFSRLPMMIFMGFTGFRSKYWAVNYDTGLCQGLYEWQTVEDAENYAKSIAMKFMRNRSVPESVEYRIIDKSAGDLRFTIE
jgi:hypothetical protein